MRRIDSTGYRRLEGQIHTKIYTTWAITAAVVLIALACLIVF